jgi:hypothetical protein
MVRFSALAVAVLTTVGGIRADETDTLLAKVKAVAPRGEGHTQAVAAARSLEKSDPTVLPRILAAMNDATPLARNWLRGAFESVAGKVLAAKKLPTKELVAFFETKTNDPQPRRLAFEWIAKADPKYAEKVIPNSLDDASSEMRRDAVAFHMKVAKASLESGDKDKAKTEYLAALSGAGDEDQVQELTKVLKDLGHEVNLIQHAGFLMKWKLIGPFDNREMKGFDVAYPPEKELDFAKSYEGQPDENGNPRKVEWKPLVSEMPDGMFDIAKLTAPHKGAITYAETEYESGTAQPVEFRLATPNAWKLWLNGKLLFAREEYHRGMFYDQYQVRGELKPGKNVLLLKVCQNEQKEDWAQDWKFQFRVCDLTGRALKPTSGQAARSNQPESRIATGERGASAP